MKISRKSLIDLGHKLGAVDVTHGGADGIGSCECIAYSVGAYGMNACVSREIESGTLYMVTARTPSLWRMM